MILASGGADRIEAGNGDDRICAGAGADVILGDGGSDRIDAGPGADSVDGGNGSDYVLAGPGSDTVVGRRGNDRLFGGDGSRDSLDGGLGDDTVSGGAGDLDQVIGSIGTDHLYGGPGNGDVLRGDHGQDVLDGGPGADDTVSFALAGRPANEIYGVPGANGGATVNLAIGLAEADGEQESLVGIEDVIGSPFPDLIFGNEEPNVLYGGGDVDDLIGVGAGDTAIGGAGLDRCRYVAVAQSCEMPGNSAAPARWEAEEVAAHEGRHIEPSFEVDLTGGEAASGLSAVVNHFRTGGQGVAVDVSFLGGAWVVAERPLPMVAGDRCVLLSPESVSCPASGTPEGIYVYGSRAADEIVVDPSVPATAGAIIVGEQGTDTIYGGAGDDSIDGSGNTDLIHGGPGEDALTGGSLLDGEGGSDLLIANDPCSDETIEGGSGIDSVSFARSESGVEATLGGTAFGAGREGERRIRGCFPGGAPTTIADSVESIEGSPYNDVLRGDSADNILLGRGGDDVLHGGGGDDFLVGGSGLDGLFGDGGEDRLYLRDDTRDAVGSCGAGGRGDVVIPDPNDPAQSGCREPVR